MSLFRLVFFFFPNIVGRKEHLVSQPLSSTLPISRLTFPHRLLSSCEMVKHHRSATLPVDEQAAEHTPIPHKRLRSWSWLLLFHGLEWDIHLAKLQQTANLWEKHLRRELWCRVFGNSLQQHSISTNQKDIWCLELALLLLILHISECCNKASTLFSLRCNTRKVIH